MTNTNDDPTGLRAMRIDDSKEFDRQYNAWLDAYDCILNEECFVDLFNERYASFGLELHSLEWNVGYCQSDYASFDGTINMAMWARASGYELDALALWMDMDQYGAHVRVRPRNHGGQTVDLDYTPGNCEPTGVFSECPHDEYEELVSEQFESRDWEQLVREWVRDVCRELYGAIRDEYEYQTSEDQFIESEEINHAFA